MNRIVTRSHRAWYGRRRWKWYWLDRDGGTISFSARSFSDEQLAWESARADFEAPVEMVYNQGHPDGHFTLYAGGQEFSD